MAIVKKYAKELYAKEVVMKAAYMFTDCAYLHLDVDTENYLISMQSKTNEYRAKTVILATGASRRAPRIKGLSDYEGKGVSYCAVCDAFFYRGKSVAVLGEGDYALHEAMELLPVVGSVSLLTNGKEPTVEFPKEITVYKDEIASFQGDNVLNSTVFKDGSTLPVKGVFVAVGVAGSSDFAKNLGAETAGTTIVVDENMQSYIGYLKM